MQHRSFRFYWTCFTRVLLYLRQRCGWRVVYSWNVCLNVPMLELRTCAHGDIHLHVPCCGRTRPSSSQTPLPPAWCSIAWDCREARGNGEKRQTYTSFLYCSSRNQTLFQSLHACQWDQIHTRAHSFPLMPDTLWTSLPLISYAHTHVDLEYLIPVAEKRWRSSGSTATSWTDGEVLRAGFIYRSITFIYFFFFTDNCNYIKSEFK